MFGDQQFTSNFLTAAIWWRLLGTGGHKRITEMVFKQHKSTGGDVENVRDFADAPPEVQRLIDPTFRAPKL